MEELFQKMLLQVLMKVHGLTEEQAAELLYQKSEDGKLDKTKLNDNALEKILDLDKERVKTLKEKGGDAAKKFEEGYNKAKAEVLTKHEAELREKYGIDDKELKGAELVERIVKQTEEASGKKASELTDADIKKHKLYLSLEKELKDKLTAAEEERTKAVEDVKKEYQRKETLNTVKGSVLRTLDELNPVLPKAATAASNLKNLFAKEYEGFNYQIGEDGSILMLNPETGERMEDAHGNPIDFKAHVTAKAGEFFEFAKQTGKGSAGNDNGGGKGGGSGAKIPQSQEEYNTLIMEASTPEERTAIHTAWEASGKGGEGANE